MRVRIDQAGKDTAARDVDQVAIEFDRRLEVGIAAHPDHPPIARRDRAVPDPSQGIAIARHHGAEQPRVSDDEIGLDHSARSMPCARAKSMAVS
jgi:hypothetical protein